jgi:outer membrane protease
MNKNRVISCFLILSATLVASFNVFASQTLLVPVDISLGFSERKDSLNWNIAGSTINILSELEWNQLQIKQIQANATLHLPQHLNLAIDIQRGSIHSGENTDSDYDGNNRTLPFSRAKSRGGGDVNDWSIGVGKEIKVIETASITPSVGWSQHQQNLTMTQGFQIIPEDEPFYGAFGGLNNRYDAKWKGLWLGIASQFSLAQQWTLSTDLKYHRVDYAADANWNLRNEFMHPLSFEHQAKGAGIEAAVAVSYPMSTHTKLHFLMQYQKWQTSKGQDDTHFVSGTTSTYVLNHVNWHSQSYGLVLIYGF